MTTITGTIEDATGANLHALLEFVTQSAPLAGAGIVTTRTDTAIRTDPSTGGFSVQLAAGNYQVTITGPDGAVSQFNIAVPNDNNTYPIDQLVTTPLAYTFIPPNTVWNGQRLGHITFIPIANPTVGPALAAAIVAGGQQTGVDQSYYCYSWQNANGDTTFVSPVSTNTPPTGSNNGTNITLPTPPAGVTVVNVFRSVDNVTFWLADTVSPQTVVVHDFMSNANFAALFTGVADQRPVTNTTAGGLYSSIGNVRVYVTDWAVWFPGTDTRVRAGKGLQLYNHTTKKWHTLTNTGNPAQLGLDAGEI